MQTISNHIAHHGLPLFSQECPRLGSFVFLASVLEHAPASTTVPFPGSQRDEYFLLW